MLRPTEEARSLVQEACPKGAYIDPLLSHCPSTHADLLASLAKRGMLEFQPAQGRKGPLGVFCDAKNSGQLRLISDT
eukprot:884154-Pyramimonas_sp.AAC.1